LALMQGLPLTVKIRKSAQRIIEWYEAWDGDVYISFSGGKDSTVLLNMVRKILGNIPAVFVDTGLEFPEIREFVKTVPNVEWIKPKNNFKQVIEKYGYPMISKEQAHWIYQVRHGKSESLKNMRVKGINKDGSPTKFKISKKWLYLINAPFEIGDECCRCMKKSPMKIYERKTKRKPFVGTMAGESVLRQKTYLKHGGCNAFNAKRPLSAPLGFWTEVDIWDYIKVFGLMYSRIYDMGYARTGCVFCGFGCHLEKEPNRFQRLYKTHPVLWDYCMRDKSKGGLGIGDVLDFINVPWK